MTMLLRLCIAVALATAASAQTTPADLLEAARAFPAQPRDSAALIPLGETGFASGTPYNDLVYTLYDTAYMDGETAGYDVFCPADPGDAFPGENRRHLLRCSLNPDLDANYATPRGDRIILGNAHTQTPFFLRGSDGIDNEWVTIQHFDYSLGMIELVGSAEDYGLLYATQADGVATEGWYLFALRDAEPDLLAFVFPCEDLAAPLGNERPWQNPDAYCNDSRSLSLEDAAQFRYVDPPDQTPVAPGELLQFGSPDKELVHAMASDEAGFIYITGASAGNLDGGGNDPGHELFLTKISRSGERLWTTEIPTADGALFFDATVDEAHVYAVGRTFGALPGFTNAGRWDAIIVKADRETGALLDWLQFGSTALDGFGNVVLDDAGHLYVSGIGSATDTGLTEEADHLLAKFRAADLELLWDAYDAPDATTVFVSEAWGGISYLPGATPGDGRVVIAGWFMAPQGADSFVSVYENLNATQPVRTATTVLRSQGIRADWILDNVLDAAGNIYVAGFTSGDLGGPAIGQGDFFVARYPPSLQDPQIVQFGTPQADAFRKLNITQDGSLVAIGYSYGDFAGTNAAGELPAGDVVVQVLDGDLNLQQAWQLGTPGEDRAAGVVSGSEVLLAGLTEGSLAAPNAGSFDAFVAVRSLAPGEELQPRTLQVAGTERRYLLSIPAQPAPPAGWPLMIMNHGGGGSPESFASATEMHLLGARDGFVTVYTKSLATGWTVGEGADPLGLQEIPYFTALLEELLAELPIDETRIYLAGHSNGGTMSHQLLHRLPGRFAGAAIVHSGLEPAMIEAPLPAPAHVALFRATADPVVPFAGGIQQPSGRTILAATEVFAYYQQALAVSPEPISTTTLPEATPDDGTTTTRRDYAPAPSGATMRTYVSEGGGHPWPGNAESTTNTGTIILDFEASEEIWEWFAEKAMPHTVLTSDGWVVF